ncbi:hypothetical protein [Streptomyces sp. NPDC051310]|uniref:hypothetical protein n=1 Tax=Streptomyces sp. NPDC051310 TaxID=3365649 RepID=UPI0037B12ED1
MESLAGADEWIADAAESVFGPGTRGGGTTMEKVAGRTRITLTTNRGQVTGWWPERTLERAWTSDMRVDAGDLAKDEVRAPGRRCAERWFPASISGSRETVDVMGEGRGTVYVLTYRRYKGGVMMPMRLDLTITSSGRMMGFASRPVPDPALPGAAISRDEAMRLAREETGVEAEAAVLLAQKIGTRWRPVWTLGVKSGSESRDLFLDAVSGKRVQPTP